MYVMGSGGLARDVNRNIKTVWGERVIEKNWIVLHVGTITRIDRELDGKLALLKLPNTTKTLKAGVKYIVDPSAGLLPSRRMIEWECHPVFKKKGNVSSHTGTQFPDMEGPAGIIVDVTSDIDLSTIGWFMRGKVPDQVIR